MPPTAPTVVAARPAVTGTTNPVQLAAATDVTRGAGPDHRPAPRASVPSPVKPEPTPPITPSTADDREPDQEPSQPSTGLRGPRRGPRRPAGGQRRRRAGFLPRGLRRRPEGVLLDQRQAGPR